MVAHARQIVVGRARAWSARWLRAPAAAEIGAIDRVLAGLVVVVVGLVYLHYALRVGSFQYDELHYMILARYVAGHFPSGLWTVPGYGWIDGIGQRLDVYLLAIPYALFRDPAAFQLDHAIQSCMFAGTAVPVVLLARRAGLGRVAAVLAGLLAVLVPWATTATSFLAEPTSYPLYAWLLYVTWMTLRRPSWVLDALAVVVLFLAALARTELIPLVIVPPLAIVWHEWSWELRAQARARRARLLVPRLWARHRLLSIVYAVAALLLLAGRAGLLAGVGLGGLTGHYGLPNLPSLSQQLSFYRYDLSRLIVGTGMLSAALAVPWTLMRLVQPRDGGRHALAVVCTLGFIATLIGLLNIAPNGDERYVMYAAVVIALGAAGALNDWSGAARMSRRAAIAFLVCAGLVVAVVASVLWPPLASDYGWFTFPAATFYQRVLLNHAADLHLSFLSEGTIVCGAIAIGAVVFVALARRPGWMRPAAALLAVGLVALCTVETIYNLRKYLNSPAGGGAPASQRAFVDEAVPGNATVAALGLTLGMTSDYFGIWNAVEFWNTSIKWDAYFQTGGYLPFQPGTTALGLGVAIPSGRITGWPAGSGAPRYLLVPAQGGNWIGFVGSTVATSPWVPLDVVKLTPPARAAWHVMGTDVYGNLPSGQAATAQIYAGALAGLGQRCASFSLITPPGFTGRWPYVVRSAGHTYRGWLEASKQTQLSVPLPQLPREADAMDTLEIEVTGHETLTTPGTAQLVFFAVGPCKSDRLTVGTSPWPPPAG